MCTLFFLFFSLHSFGQWSNLELSTGVGMVLVDGERSWLNGDQVIIFTKSRYHMGRDFSLTTGLGVLAWQVASYRDYDIQFGCDNRNGVVDPYNSYFEYATDKLSLILPLEASYTFGRLDVIFGFEALYLLQSKPRIYLVECGSMRRPSTLPGFNQRNVDENYLNAALSLGGSIGLFKSQKLRLIPRFKYVLTPTTIEGLDAINEWMIELAIGYRFEF